MPSWLRVLLSDIVSTFSMQCAVSCCSLGRYVKETCKLRILVRKHYLHFVLFPQQALDIQILFFLLYWHFKTHSPKQQGNCWKAVQTINPTLLTNKFLHSHRNFRLYLFFRSLRLLSSENEEFNLQWICFVYESYNRCSFTQHDSSKL